MLAPVDPAQLTLESTAGATFARRSDHVYGTHAYHTKVPPRVARDYIERHTEPGDLVVDPFCGSGMTGVGAAMAGRRAFLSDLSPAAVHIARNYTEPCDAPGFGGAAERVLVKVGAEIAALYASHYDGAPATVEHVVWSDVRACPRCEQEILLWDLRDRGLRRVRCFACDHEGPKASFPVTDERPVQTALKPLRGTRQIVRDAEESDWCTSLPNPMPWYPTDRFDSSRPMWRKGHADLDIRTVADFYTPRNLAALGLLWQAATEEPDERLRSALHFSLTAIANRASRRYQWNAKRPTNVLGGTLYVSSLRYEWNVLSLWRRKVAAVHRLFSGGVDRSPSSRVCQASARLLPLPDASADFCFSDPPFGAHIVYSDASLLWEAWLGKGTDRDEEAIVVRAGDRPKSVATYAGLLEDAFGEIHRVLKPGARAAIVFQATDAEVWEGLREAAARVGFQLEDVDTLHKGQPSFKQVKGNQDGERVAHSDAVLTFARGGARSRRPSAATVVECIRGEIVACSAAGRRATTGHLYGASASARLRQGKPPLSFDEVAALLDEHFVCVHGGWNLSEERCAVR